LFDRRVRAAFADYWISRKLTFTGERIVVAPTTAWIGILPILRKSAAAGAGIPGYGNLLHTRYAVIALSLLGRDSLRARAV
jgi:hypothetical protein